MGKYHSNGGLHMGLRRPKSIKHKGKSLADILEAHERFFSGKEGGTRADLTGADLSHADLSGANLSGARFSGGDMGVGILRETDLTGADLSGVDLSTELRPRGFGLPRAAKKS